MWPSLPLGALQPAPRVPAPSRVCDGESRAWGRGGLRLGHQQPSRGCPVRLTRGPGQGQAAPARVLSWPVSPCRNCGQWSVASHRLVPGKADSGDIQGSEEEGVCPARRSESTGSKGPPVGLRPAGLSLTS